MNVGSTVAAIDPVMFGKTAMPVVPRLAANSIVVAKATSEKIDAATANPTFDERRDGTTKCS